MIEQGVSARVSSAAGLAWLFPVGLFTEWKVLAQMVADQLARAAILSCVTMMGDEADALVKVVPTWSHLTDGPKLNLALANKHLVRWPSKVKMNEGAVRLEKALKHVSLVFTAWGLPGKVEEEDDDIGYMTTINAVYSSAKKTITLTAIINILANATPQQGAER